MRKKYYEIRKLFFYCTKRRCSEIKPQFKVEIDGREAPKNPSNLYICL